MPPSAVPLEWELPKLRYSVNFEDDRRSSESRKSDTEFFDVKFYPYNPVGSSPVFAAVSKWHIFICRLNQTKDKDANPCEILQVIRDDDVGALNCSCTWTRDPETERALLCVSGRDGKVKVYRIRDGKPHTSFVGHGGEINDLATSPANPHLIASASDDTTVRIWSLNPVHKRQPCVILLAGEGHSWNLLSVAFHDSGRYVLSAGHDQVINLWTLPDFPEEHMESPMVVHYPHFSTSEIHTGLIDCVAFYGDLILSRACHEDVIVLWRIEGFSSEDEPPSPEQAPSNHDTAKLTRSAFSAAVTAPAPTANGTNGTNGAAPVSFPAPPQYTRLLQLHTPGCGPQFFMRFGLFNVAGHHPTLAFCNANAKIFFWDFACFSAYQDFITSVHRADSAADIPQRPPWLRAVPPRRRHFANNGSSSNTHTGRFHGDSTGRLRETSTGMLGGGGSGGGGSGGGGSGGGGSGGGGSGGGGSGGGGSGGGGSGGGGSGGGGSGHGGSRDADRVEASDKDSVLSGPGAAAAAGTAVGNGAAAAAFAKSEAYSPETLEEWKHKYDMSNPHAQLKAHKVEVIKGQATVGRQVAWSPEGEWCVIVGSNSRVLVLQRWANGEAAHAGEEGGE